MVVAAPVAAPGPRASGPARPWVGYAGFGWAFSYIPIHVYWALGGRSGSLGITGSLPDWEMANWGASVLILGAGLLCLALVQPWGAILPRPLLHGAAWVGGVFGLLHAVVLSAVSALQLAGVVDYPADSDLTTEQLRNFAWANLLYFEPWFAVMAVLLIGCSRHARRRDRTTTVRGPLPPAWVQQAAWARPVALVAVTATALLHVWALVGLGVQRLAGAVGVAMLTALAVTISRRLFTAWRHGATTLTLTGLVAVLWGVYTFDPWVFGLYGSTLMAAGLIGLLGHAASSTPPGRTRRERGVPCPPSLDRP